MTVTTGGRRTALVTCAPRWNGTQEVVAVPATWKSVAEKLADIGTRRMQLPRPSPQRHDEQEARQREAIWAEIRRWSGKADKLGMPARTAMTLLGLSHWGYYNIINHHVGQEATRPNAAPKNPGPAQIRAWAREHGVAVPRSGPIPRPVLEAYLAAIGT